MGHVGHPSLPAPSRSVVSGGFFGEAGRRRGAIHAVRNVEWRHVGRLRGGAVRCVSPRAASALLFYADASAVGVHTGAVRGHRAVHPPSLSRGDARTSPQRWVQKYAADPSSDSDSDCLLLCLLSKTRYEAQAGDEHERVQQYGQTSLATLLRGVQLQLRSRRRRHALPPRRGICADLALGSLRAG